MSIDEAVKQMLDIIGAACASAEVKVAKISDNEARLSVYAPAAEMQAVKDAAFLPAMDFLTNDGMDVQVFVYNKDAPRLDG